MSSGQHQPYNRGYQAYFNSEDISDNPFDYGTTEFDAWENGFKEAEDDDSAASNFGEEDDEFDLLFREQRESDYNDDN